MTPATTPRPASSARLKKMLTDLQLLVESLDDRVRRPERLAEAGIAGDAADLRRRAVDLIHEIEVEIERTSPGPETPRRAHPDTAAD
jgi:hypothetical protein